ncbi:MAG: hypothetical protein Ct9H300mP25_16260 [Acidobacteriota bacterium]|nr:MAG: hypothetical protein Ct9H300mP25_16260 [Acidobacteriota bacterium]
MTIGMRKGGPRPLFFCHHHAFTVLVCSFPTYSQTVDMSTLEQCIALETEELKLRCFEAIIASGGTGTEEEVTAPNLSVAVARRLRKLCRTSSASPILPSHLGRRATRHRASFPLQSGPGRFINCSFRGSGWDFPCAYQMRPRPHGKRRRGR